MNNEELKQHARNIRKNIVKEIANAQSCGALPIFSAAYRKISGFGFFTFRSPDTTTASKNVSSPAFASF